MNYDLIALWVIGVLGFVSMFAALVLTLYVAALQRLATMDASNELPSGTILLETAVEHLAKSRSPDIDRFLSSKKVRWYMKLFGRGGIRLDRITEQEIRNDLLSSLMRELEKSHRVSMITINFDRNELIDSWHLIEPLGNANKCRYQNFLRESLESIKERKIRLKLVRKL